MTLDLLREPLIQTDAGWHSLPGLLAALAQGAVQVFPALRPHQRPAWHMFLVQLSVLALDAAGHRDLPPDEETWRSALRALTSGFPDDEPWHLIGPDRTRPAFLQPADPGGLKWSQVATPDALDMLITSRNHDVKREIARKAAPQDWIFALVSLQTMEGFGGRDNFGVARMNGAYSSRVLVGLAPTVEKATSISPSSWWARDCRILLRKRSDHFGPKLLWQEPWAEGRPLEKDDLDPLFIEVCRRVRLSINGYQISAERATSKGPRIGNHDVIRGNTSDPWAPIKTPEGNSLTLAKTRDQDWTCAFLVKLLYADPTEWQRPLLAETHSEDLVRPMALVFEAFARGQSKTDGFKSRVVPVPVAMVRELFGERPKVVTPGLLADIAAVSNSLSEALELVGTEGDKEKRLKLKERPKGREKLNRYSAAAREALRRHADHLFFPQLWARMAAKSDAELAPIRVLFLERLARIAREEFARAVPAIPCASLMRPRAEARGRQELESCLARAMPEKQAEGTHVEA